MAKKAAVQNSGRAHIQSRFTRESLMDRQVIESTDRPGQLAVLPELNIIALGGRSILDRGAAAILPLADEIVANRFKHQMLLCTGPGICSRQTQCLGLDLGLPTGGMAMLTGGDESKYLFMLFGLLAPHGGVWMAKLVHFERLPLYLKSHMIPVTLGQPPYFYWEKPPEYGSLPEHGNDFGTFMTAETLGVRSLIYVKDVDGLYTADPKRDRSARFIPRIGVHELLALDLPELVLERSVLTNLARAHALKQVQIINGLTSGNLSRALEGEPVGTVIYQDAPVDRN